MLEIICIDVTRKDMYVYTVEKLAQLKGSTASSATAAPTASTELPR